MARRTWRYIEGVAYEVGVDEIPDKEYAPTFIPDIQPFRSPVDGTMITSRSSLRNHNKRNGVIQTEELKGLPTRMANPEYQLSKKEVQERRAFIAEQAYRHKLI